MKIRPVGAELLHADKETQRQVEKQKQKQKQKQKTAQT